MKLFSGCYTSIHKSVRAIGLLLFFFILGLLFYGVWYVQPNSVRSIWYWIGVLLLLLVWAGLAFWEILLIRKHFLARNEEELGNFLTFVEEQKKKLNLDQTSLPKSGSKE